jgi:photosystem II stability/assembly factor-like uncharacterized protein
MATLIKNLPNPAVAAKGNRGILTKAGTGFPLYTEWFNLITNVEDLTIIPAEHALIIREPLEDSAALVEESSGSFRQFYAIPSNTMSKTGSLGLPTDGPLELTTAMANNFGDVWVSLDITDVLNPSEIEKPWSNVLVSNTGTTITAMTMNGEVFVTTDSGSNWFLRKRSGAEIWKKIVISADGIYQTAITQEGLIYVSSDSGTTWIGKQPSRQWADIAMSSDGRIQTAVVSEGQIFVSTDYGNNWAARSINARWTKIEMSSNGAFQTALFYSPIAQTRTDLYVSSDFGVNWEYKSVSPDLNVSSFKMSSNGLNQFIVTSYRTLYISRDGGNTWTAKEYGNARGGIIAVAPDGTKLTIIAQKIEPAQPSGLVSTIYVSIDSGNTWLPKSIQGLTSTSVLREVVMSADGTKQVVAECAPNSRIWVSSDSGSTWSLKETKRNWSSIAIPSNGSKILATVNPGKIFMYAS